MSCSHDQAALFNFCASICTKIHDETDSYSALMDYWIRCLYEGKEGDPADVEKGFLQGKLLVKVHISTVAPAHRLLTTHPFKTFKVIFILPSLVDHNPGEQNNQLQRGKSGRIGPPKQTNNTELHQMDGSVTPCTIAYAAVQVCNLCSLCPTNCECASCYTLANHPKTVPRS